MIAGLKFIGEQTAGRAFEYGSSSLLELVFGGNDESAQIIAKLTQIQGQLDDIERKIAQVIAQFDKQACYLQVNNYLSKFSAEMRWDLSKLNSMVESIDALPDGSEKEARRKEFAENLYSNPRYQVCGRIRLRHGRRPGQRDYAVLHPARTRTCSARSTSSWC